MRFSSSLKCLTNAHSYKWGPVPLQLLSIFHSFCFFSFFFFEASVNFAPISAAAAVDVDMYVAMWMRLPSSSEPHGCEYPYECEYLLLVILSTHFLRQNQNLNLTQPGAIYHSSSSATPAPYNAFSLPVSALEIHPHLHWEKLWIYIDGIKNRTNYN